MTHRTTAFPSHCDEAIPTGEGQTSWEPWDAATWRLTAFDLLDVDLNRTYLELGCKNIAQYADWELGLLPGYAAELLRIAQKLLDLPEIDRALSAGELTWEQVVVLTRVAVPRHEYAWLDRALEVPLEELTQLVERSAEGWAPPIDVFSRGATPPSGSRLGRAADGTAARSKIALCSPVFSRGATPPSGSRLGRAAAGTAARSKIALSSPDEGWLHVSRMAAVPIVAGRQRGGRAAGLGGHTGAPNVRQPFHPPPSTS